MVQSEEGVVQDRSSSPKRSLALPYLSSSGIEVNAHRRGQAETTYRRVGDQNHSHERQGYVRLDRQPSSIDSGLSECSVDDLNGQTLY